MAAYVTKAKLRELVIASQAAGQVNAGLADVVRQMAVGLVGRYGLPLDHDDAAQACILLACRKIGNMDPEKGCFSYLTTCCFNELRKLLSGDARWVRLIDQAAARMRPDRRHVQRKTRRRDDYSMDHANGYQAND